MYSGEVEISMEPELESGEVENNAEPEVSDEYDSSSSYYTSSDEDEMEMDEMGEDRLSELPDPILHHILSFLPDAKLVIPTAILSRRWRYVWTTLPFLSFDRDRFKAIGAFTFLAKPDFVRFVNQFLAKRDTSSNVSSFRLYWGNGFCHPSHISSWLRYVVKRNVEEIDIQIAMEDRLLELPPSLFTSKSLTSLKLDLTQRSDPTIIPLPESVDLPMLKTLSLLSTDYIGHEFIDMYFSGCPVLENLTLIGCYMEDEKNLVFSAPQLKHLELGIFEKDAWDKSKTPKICVSAPNLISFTCSDYVSHNYSFENLSKLEAASMEMTSPENDYYYEADEDDPPFTKEDTKRMIKCLKELYNVKSLTLNHMFLEVISRAPEVLTGSFIPLSNLRYLKLVTWIGKAHVCSIKYLLENSPNTETLAFDLMTTGEPANVEEYWKELDFSALNLKYIEVFNFHGRHDQDLDFLKIILNKAVGLEKLSIFIKQWSKLSEERLNFFQEKLLTYRQANPNIKIVFREPEEIDEDSYESSLDMLSILLAGDSP